MSTENETCANDSLNGSTTITTTTTTTTINQETSSSAEAQAMLDNFWPNAIEDLKDLRNHDFKNQELPLARIKRIMKLDDDAAMMMISGEAPVLFAKAAELFISELSLRGWVHTEENKRRTLQRNDIAMAITKYDQFDFLIDIVPREELQRSHTQQTSDQQMTGYTEFPTTAQIVGSMESVPIENVTQEQLQAYIQFAQPQIQTVAPATVELNSNMTSQLIQDSSSFHHQTAFNFNGSSNV